MANKTIYPYGTGGSLPSSIGLINDLTTGGVDKALTAEQGKVLNRKFNRVLFTNSAQADWKTGNLSSGKIVTNYANKYLIVKIPSGVEAVTVIRTAPDSTYTLNVSGSSDGTNFTNISSFGKISGRETISTGSYNQLLFLLWDRPSTERARQEGLTVEFIDEYPLTKFDIADDVYGTSGLVVDASLFRRMANDLWIKTLAPPSEQFYWAQGGINGNTGAEESNVGAIRSNWIKVRKTDQVYILENPISGRNFFIVFYDDGKNKVGNNASHWGELPEIQQYITTDFGYFRMVYYGAGAFAPTNEDAKKARIRITASGGANGGDASSQKYANPVLRVSNPDPTVWDGEDGYYYLFATGSLSTKKMYRSSNLVNWEPTGDAPFDEEEAAKVATAFDSSLPSASFWAPHVYKVNPTTWNLYLSKPNGGGAAVLTSNHPTRGYKYVKMLSGCGGQDIDYDLAFDIDGKWWMFSGGGGSVYRREVTDDGLNWAQGSSGELCAGLSSSVGREETYEGPYLYRRNGYWYLFCSSGDYGGSGYKLRVVRSESLGGTFVDKAGHASTDGYAEVVLSTDSNSPLYGPGHNAQIFVDSNNETWIVYHSWWGSSDNGRCVCLDKVEWDENGWPFINDGHPSVSHDAPGSF